MSTKENRAQKIFFGMIFATIAFGTAFASACHFGSFRAPPAILAEPPP